MIRLLVLATLLLAGCSSGGPSAPQVLTDVANATQAAIVVVPKLTTTQPPVLTMAQSQAILADLNQAAALEQGLATTAAANASLPALGQIEALLSSALTSLSSAAVPAPYDLVIAASSVILPELESYIASVSGTPPNPVAIRMGARATANGMTLDQARVIVAQRH